MTESQFDTLVNIAEGKGANSDCDNNFLESCRYVSGGKITEKGLTELEKFRVKRAVFMAAGFGSRLVPVTINTPKPLVRVKGKRIIDGLIDACIAAGIEEIYIVRGYLGEQFDQLLYKYPNIKFIDNPLYGEANNISSVIAAGNLVENAYILESDLLISNPNIIRKYHYRSDVLGIDKKICDDWCFKEKDGFVDEELEKGENCVQMVGIYYFNEEDGKELQKDLKEAYALPDGNKRYWETVPNQLKRGKYKIKIIKCLDGDVTEIDTFEELKKLDDTYAK